MTTEVMIGEVAALSKDGHRVLSIDGFEIGLFALDAQIVAYENRCPHDGGPVCQGKVINRVEEIIDTDKTSRGLRFSQRKNVVCPWHGFEFDLETGAGSGGSRFRLRKLKVTVRDAHVFVTIP